MTRRKQAPAAVAATLGRDLAALGAALGDGADANAADSDGRTALHHAAINGDVEAVLFLLDTGAHVDVADANGWTALHFAARDYHVEVARVLLNAGASVDAEDAHGNTPLFRAVFESRGRGEMILLLRTQGADASHPNRHGSSPLALANTIANFEVKKWLD
jgi:uncharacterized protein